jgi:hypothetical protein
LSSLVLSSLAWSAYKLSVSCRGAAVALAVFKKVTQEWEQAMGRLGTFFFGMIAGLTIFYVANYYHIVRSSSGVFVIPKINQNLSDTYVDTRNFDLSDWQQHRMLAASILRSERKELLDDSTLSGFRTSVTSLLSQWMGD